MNTSVSTLHKFQTLAILLLIFADGCDVGQFSSHHSMFGVSEESSMSCFMPWQAFSSWALALRSSIRPNV